VRAMEDKKLRTVASLSHLYHHASSLTQMEPFHNAVHSS
jgi:hypothetical protein